jgi:uncharacterized membrane protein
MSVFLKHQNADAVLIELIRGIDPSITDQQIVKELEIHPEYPSFLALNDVLNNFGIASDAYRVPVVDLHKATFPFIAHTRMPGSEFLLVTDLNQDSFTVTDQNKKNFNLSFNDFSVLYTGVILMADRPLATSQKNKKSLTLNKSDSSYFLAIGLTVLAFVIVLANYSNVFTTWQTSLVSLFKTVGILVSVLLLIQSIDNNNPFVQTLCGGGGKSNCNAILGSKSAKVFEGLSWSEVGFFYFMGTWLALLFSGNNTGMLQALAILNLMCLPYTVYSIYFQARIAKQWCILCCTVQALLWLEFIPMVGFLHAALQLFSLNVFNSLIVCFALPIASWLFLKPFFLKAQQVKSYKYHLQKLKYNSKLFNSLLKEQPKYATPAEDWSIVLGNVEAETVITIVSNLFCRPCAKMHKTINELLEKNANVQVRFVFTVKDTEDNIQLPIVKHLIALNELADKSIIKNALHDWYEYEPSDYKAWSTKYPVDIKNNDWIISNQQSWCNTAEIKFTPTVLLNGYILPEVYQMKNIKYMLN